MSLTVTGCAVVPLSLAFAGRTGTLSVISSRSGSSFGCFNRCLGNRLIGSFRLLGSGSRYRCFRSGFGYRRNDSRGLGSSHLLLRLRFLRLYRLFRRGSRSFLLLLSGLVLLSGKTNQTSVLRIRINRRGKISVFILFRLDTESVFIKHQLLQIALLVKYRARDRKRIAVGILAVNGRAVLVEQLAALCIFLLGLHVFDLALSEETLRNRDGVIIDKTRYALGINAFFAKIRHKVIILYAKFSGQFIDLDFRHSVYLQHELSLRFYRLCPGP